MPTTEIPTELIERALALTGKTMRNCELPWYLDNGTPVCGGYEFSIKEFTYYLLSPSFIEKYYIHNGASVGTWSERFGKAIHEYQKGNSDPLIELLEKINP